MKDKRFEVIEKQGKMEVFQVIRDNHTGVLYLSHSAGYDLGLTVMQGPDGKPLLDEDFNANESFPHS